MDTPFPHPPESITPPADLVHPAPDSSLLPQLELGELAKPYTGTDVALAPKNTDITAPPERGHEAPRDALRSEDVALHGGAAALEGAEEQTKRPFSIVEIGSGGSPVLMDYDAPDIQRLYTEGGRYTAVDAKPWALQTAAVAANNYIGDHADPDVAIETNFQVGCITPETPMPEGLSPGSADRVVVSNVLTHDVVARQPEICKAIASTVSELLRPDGEAVFVGTLSPTVFPPERVTQLMESVGLEHVGSDDVSLHYQPEFREGIPDTAYAERYRHRQTDSRK